MKRILLFSIISILVFECSAQNWDINTLKRINNVDNSFIKGYSKGISNTEPYLAIGIPLLMGSYSLITDDKKLLEDAIYVGSSVAEAVIISTTMKELVDRERPYIRYPDLITNRSVESSSSFPSAHTATAFSLATSLSIRYPKWYVIAPSYLWACSVGFSRMNIGVHYPSDVFAGAVIGTGCAVINVYINKYLQGIIYPKGVTKTIDY